MTRNQRGALAVTLAMFLYVLNDIVVKTLSATMPPSQIMAVRGAMASLLAFLWIVQAKELDEFKPFFKSPLAIMRGASESLVAFLFITSIVHISLSDASAIMLSTPLMITALSVFMLKEKVGWRRWLAIMIGFIGVLFILKPTGNGLGVWGLLALLCALITALRDIITRKISAELSSRILMFFSCLSVFILGVILYPTQNWVSLTTQEMFMFSFAATMLMFGNYFMAEAFREIDVSFVSPFRYTVIIFASLASYLIWGDRPDFWGYFGTFLIISSGLYSLYRERTKKI